MLSTTLLDGKQRHLCLDLQRPRRSCVGRLAHFTRRRLFAESPSRARREDRPCVDPQESEQWLQPDSSRLPLSSCP